MHKCNEIKLCDTIKCTMIANFVNSEYIEQTRLKYTLNYHCNIFKRFYKYLVWIIILIHF